MPGSRAVVVLIVAVAAAVVLWQKTAPQPDPHVASSASERVGKAATSSTATAADNRHAPPTSSGAQSTQITATPPAPSSGVTASAATSAAPSRSAALRLDVRAPPSAHVGDRFTVTIDAEAFHGIRNLSFGVTYDRQILEFVSSSPGSFVRQASALATFSAEDTSAGNVFVSMDIKNGGVVAAAGTVVVIEFTALRAGTSPITPTEVSFLESGRSSRSTAAAVRPASVTIE